jgi:hypothetical protein
MNSGDAHILLSKWFKELIPQLEGLQRECDYSPPSSIDVKKNRSITPLLHTSSRFQAYWLSTGIVYIVLLLKQGNVDFGTNGTRDVSAPLPAVYLLIIPTMEHCVLCLCTSADLMRSNSMVSFKRPHELYTNVTQNWIPNINTCRFCSK